MSISLEELIPSGAGLVATLVSIVGLWFKFQNKVDNLEGKDISQQKQIDDIIKWSHDHEKEDLDKHQSLSKDISHIEGSLLVRDEQFKAIMSALDDIKERLLNLENK